MSRPTTPIVYEPSAGMHIAMAATVAIAMARHYNRKVRFTFNEVKLTVNKRLSPRHVQRTFEHICESHAVRYFGSFAELAERKRRAAEIKSKQEAIDKLLSNLPSTKLEAAAFLARWVHLADDVGVEGRQLIVSNALRALGFVKSQHVGDPRFLDGTIDQLSHIEYIAGQVLSMLDAWGCVHPMVGKWAEELAEKIKWASELAEKSK